jgi:hypothetical protein
MVIFDRQKIIFIRFKMVGIYRKVKQILQLVKDIAPYIDRFAPGLGSLINMGAGLGGSIADGTNNVWEDYQTAKKSGTTYGVGDGVRSFVRKAAKEPSAVSKLTKDYGGLHPRLRLKEDTQEINPDDDE